MHLEKCNCMRERIEIPSIETLNSLLNYCPETGTLQWKAADRGRRVGVEAGSNDRLGYRAVHIMGKRYLSHRVIWKMVLGMEPPETLDHINGNKQDNRIANLRESEAAENLHNAKRSSRNSSGVKGVRYVGWTASIATRGNRKFLGNFDSKEEAEKAVRAAREELHGKFANHG